MKGRDPVSNRQKNQLAFISEFCTDIAHVPGMDNTVADTLSRQFDVTMIVNTIAHQLSDVDLEVIAEDQIEQEIHNENTTSLKLELVEFPGVQAKVWCDTSGRIPRVYVPRTWRKKIFTAVHSLAHPSGRATQLQ